MTRRHAGQLAVVLSTLAIIGGVCMPHGAPDWYNIGARDTLHGMSDMGELAARLGSIDTFERAGNVVWLSGFENGLGEWQYGSVGTGGSLVVSTQEVQSGSYAVRLTPGSDSSRLAWVTKRFPYPALSRFGHEVAFTWNTGLDSVEVQTVLLDGSEWTQWILKFSQTDGKVYYFNSAGGWTELDTMPNWLTESKLFHVVKLVVDLEAKQYVRCLVDHKGYPMPGIDARVETSLVAPRLVFNLEVHGPAGGNPAIYADNVIFTQNAP